MPAKELPARAVESLDDPVASFVDAACLPRDGRGHNSAALDEPEAIVTTSVGLPALKSYNFIVPMDYSSHGLRLDCN